MAKKKLLKINWGLCWISIVMLFGLEMYVWLSMLQRGHSACEEYLTFFVQFLYVTLVTTEWGIFNLVFLHREDAKWDYQ